ncbi:DsrE family protein [Candidatus Thiothrix sp. Deng01]|uniref:DsrE family protein n=1 Tax=Candidatus Thiothrix phosphatis TaxID=3112415 RepID=A0ABU6CYM0_9GAMM|nr:DsrE family protein [Candidatus Thiothrix sp. Deng01]MEB4591931.1 DsrE family protein [Candidatus Thiothrix sp. Deng01]
MGTQYSLEAGNNRHYVVVLTSGKEDGGKRATLAFAAACSAAAMDMNPHVFLIGDGSYWAYEGHTHGIHAAGFPPLEDLVENYLDLGGNLYVCSACDQVCSVAPDNSFPLPAKRVGIEPRGLASVLQYTVSGGSITF